MATFRIGDRVRVLTPGSLHGHTATIYDIHHPPRWLWPWERDNFAWSGDAVAEGVHPRETAYLLDVDGIGKRCNPFSFDLIGSPAYWLRPLEDPKADEFIERIKKLKPYDEPLVTKVRA